MQLTAQQTHKRRNVTKNVDGDADILMLNDEVDTATASSQPQRQSDNELEEESTEETPMSSQSSGTVLKDAPGRALKELAQPRVNISAALAKRANLKSGGDVNFVNEDDDLIITSSAIPARRRVRAGFVFDSDDED